MKCPHCGEETAIRKINKMDGWTVVGTSGVCALCGREIAPAAAEQAVAARSSKLASLLGEGAAVTRPALAPDDATGRFCNNCEALVVHPFKTLCSLTLNEVDPMGECPKFKPKTN